MSHTETPNAAPTDPSTLAPPSGASETTSESDSEYWDGKGLFANLTPVQRTHAWARALSFQLQPCSRCGGLSDYQYGDWWTCRDCGKWRRTIKTIGSIITGTYKFWRNCPDEVEPPTGL